MPYFRSFALALMLAVTGCATTDSSAPQSGASSNEDDLARALALYSQGLTYTMGQAPSPNRAIIAFEQALILDPSQWRIYSHLSQLYVGQRRLDEAVHILQKATLHSDDPYLARLTLASTLASAKRYEETIAPLREAIELKPTESEPRLKLALAHLTAGDYENFYVVTTQALNTLADRTPILAFLYTQGRQLVLDQKYEIAARCFEFVESITPDDLALKTILKSCYAETGDLTNQIRVQKYLAEHSPKKSLNLYFLGELYEAAGDEKLAAEAYQQACDSDPEFPDPFLKLSQLYYMTDLEKSRDVMRKAAEVFPEEPSVHAISGMIYSFLQDFESAVKSFEKAEALAAAAGMPELAFTDAFYHSYGASCERLGQYERATDYFERSIRINPDDHRSRNYLAYMWAELGINLKQARQYVDKALEIDPGNGAYLDTLGWVLYQQNDFEGALEFLMQAYEKVKYDAVITEHIADCYAGMNRKDELLNWLNKSHRLDPAKESIREKMQRHGLELLPADTPPDIPEGYNPFAAPEESEDKE